VAAAEAVDRTAEVFADILCSDPEWVDAEFEEIVSGFWKTPTPTPTSTTASPRPRIVRAWLVGGQVAPHWGNSGPHREFRATIRSPPRSAAGHFPALDILRTRATHPASSFQKGESHYVDVI
jgi:hypothetical protein